MKFPNVNKTEIGYFAIQGGEDIDTPQISVQPGMLSLSRNYECDTNGRLRRIDGYEAFDGHPKPSEASYWKLGFTQGTVEVANGATVTGTTSTKSGKKLYQVVESGSYAESNAAGYLILTNVTGSFVDAENLHVSGVSKAWSSGVGEERGVADETLDATYYQAAIEDARDQIAAVPGSGDILGVYQLNGVKIAFRNNAGGTAAAMYKSSAAGWVQVTMGTTLAFTSGGGAYTLVEGDTITGATSAKTAVVRRIVITAGTFAGGDAAGVLTLSAQSGAFQSENLNVGANLNVATIAGNSTAITLAKDGRYEFVTHNFYSSTDTIRVYGCDGKNKAFEWDGTTYVPITTGMAVDTPIHIAVHYNHLFLAFPHGSLQHSATLNPHSFSALTGASEIGLGDDITGLEVIAGPLLAIWTRNSIGLLYGTSADSETDPWVLKPGAIESGGIEWTVQRIGSGIFLDNRGLTTLASVQEYGDFKSNVISKPVQSFLDSMVGSVQGSVRVRSKNQYRLFFTDKQALIFTSDNNKVVGYTRALYDHLPVCSTSTENELGEEEILFGSTDGFVYQMDKGTSFNGEPVTAFLRTHYNNFKSPSTRKRIRKIKLEMDAPMGAEIYLTVSYDYGVNDNTLQAVEALYGATSPGGLWGFENWGSFVWGAPIIDTAEIKVDGSGTSFAITIASESTYDRPHTIQGAIVHFDRRGHKR